ncbi:MAG: PH domain-containing protein [Candidatus Lernaella stagnicola]|nr:PH domain-containing protein [Candidatus Lernaella stagnicola]
MGVKCDEFRMSFTACYRGLAVVLFTFLFVLLAARVIKEVVFYDVSDFDAAMLVLRLAAGTGFGLVVLLPFAYALVGRCRVTVTAEGIAGRSFFGRLRRIEWADLASVKSANFLTMKYAELHAKNGKSLVVPLFLEDMAAFCAAVDSVAPPESPLIPFLEERSAGRKIA